MFDGLGVLIYIVFLAVPAVDSSVDLLNEERYNAGKNDLAYFNHEASLPKFGKCWLAALEELEIGCNKLTEDELYRMTFSFMNCFLMKTGRDRQECLPNSNIEDCTKLLKSEAYAVYTKFFTHTQNVCFFLQAQKWQATTKLAVNRLVDTSLAVSSQMENSKILQSEILKRQGDSIHLQEILLESGNLLKKTLFESKSDLDKVMADFKTSSSEQKDLLFDVFYKIKSFQSLVVGEMTGFLSLAFYLVTLLISYLITSTRRSSSARLPLFMILTANLVVERMLFNFMRFDDKENPLDESFAITEEEYYQYRDVSRVMSGILSLLTVLWYTLRYQDVGLLNNNLLKEIQQRNTIYEQKVLGRLDDLVKKQEEQCGKYDECESVGYGSDFDSTSSTDTLDQTEDKTFQLESSFISRTSTIDLREDLRFLHSSTPVKDFVKDGIISVLNASIGQSKENDVSRRSNKTITPTNAYNLRPRKTPDRYSVGMSETSIEFGKKIKALEKESKRKTLPTKGKLK